MDDDHHGQLEAPPRLARQSDLRPLPSACMDIHRALARLLRVQKVEAHLRQVFLMAGNCKELPEIWQNRGGQGRHIQSELSGGRSGRPRAAATG
jgi:hypothetical protein